MTTYGPNPYYIRKAEEYRHQSKAYEDRERYFNDKANYYLKEARDYESRADYCAREAKRYCEQAGYQLKNGNMIGYNSEKYNARSAESNRQSYLSKAQNARMESRKCEHEAAAAKAMARDYGKKASDAMRYIY